MLDDLNSLATNTTADKLNRVLKDASKPGAKWIKKNGEPMTNEDLLALRAIQNDPEFDDYGPIEKYFTTEAIDLLDLASASIKDFPAVEASLDKVMEAMITEDSSPGMACVVSFIACHACMKFYEYCAVHLLKGVLSGEYRLDTSNDDSRKGNK